jgi:cephalosporin-C deacetylase-like acetyl esterase
MTRRRSFFVVLIAIPAAIAACAHRQTQAPVRLTAVPYKASGIYALGEKVGWTITLPEGTVTPYSYTLKRNNQEIVESGRLDLSTGRATVETSLTEPAMLYLEITHQGGRPAAFGAAVAPTKLRPVVERPKDFDAFWKRKIAELKAVPENPVLTPETSYSPDVDYATIRMDHVNGTHVYGHLAKPKKPGKYPAILILQWASPPYPLQPAWVIEPAKQGFLALNIEPHDVLPAAPSSYYQGLPAELKNYASIGREDRETSYFVEMYLRDYRAADYLSHCPEWNGKVLAVMGTSMGGQQSFAVAGLHPKITHLMVDVPAGADLNASLHGRQMGYPFFNPSEPKTMEAARYVDAINFAPHIKATSLVAMGFVDTISPPAGVWTVFNLIKGKKEAVPMIDSPHNNLATPEQQRPWTERSAAWLASLAQTGKVEVRSLPNLK